MEKNCCAFTGHRPKSFPWKYDESASDCILLKDVLSVQLGVLVDKGVTDFLFGEDEDLDIEKAASFLCADCLNEILPHDPSRYFGVGAIHLDAKEIHDGFTLGDFYVDCGRKGQTGDSDQIGILFVQYVMKKILNKDFSYKCAGGVIGWRAAPISLA